MVQADTTSSKEGIPLMLLFIYFKGDISQRLSVHYLQLSYSNQHLLLGLQRGFKAPVNPISKYVQCFTRKEEDVVDLR